MISSNKFKCLVCGYETNRKYNLKLHTDNESACKKRLNRLNIDQDDKNVNVFGKNVNVGRKNVNVFRKNVNVGRKNVNVLHNCDICNKNLSSRSYLIKHQNKCKGSDSFQCNTCKKFFPSRQAKYQHIKNVKCEFLESKDEKDIRIKELEKQLLEERSKTTVQNITINNHFNPNIQYNNYNSPETEHINYLKTIKSYVRNGRNLPMTFHELGVMILEKPENRSVVLPEGQKANYCLAIVNKKQRRLPTKHVLPGIVSCTATKMFEDFNTAKDEEIVIGPKLDRDIEVLDKLQFIDLEDDDEDEEYQNLRKEFCDIIKQALL